MNLAEDLLANVTRNEHELPIDTEDIPENNLIIKDLSWDYYNTGHRYKMELKSDKYSKELKFKLGEHVKGKLKTGRHRILLFVNFK